MKRNKVLSHLCRLKVHIAFLQETHLKDIDHSRLKRSWVGQIFHSSFNGKARGAAILVNKNTPFIMSDIMTDSNGRYVIVTGSLFNTPIILVNIYGPNFDDPKFFNNLIRSLPLIDTHQLILGGDMNTVMDLVLDRSSTKNFSLPKSSIVLQSFLQNYGAVDIWRHLYPCTRQYSFFSAVHQTYSRIDYFFVDKKLLPNIKTCRYDSIVISDHSPLILELSFPDKRSVYSWRLNPLLLSDKEFVQYISEQIDFFLKMNISPGIAFSTVWESLKAFLRGHIISYCSHTKKQKVKRLSELTNLISQLDKQHSITPSPDLFKQRLTLQTEFNLTSTEQSEQMILKSRRMWYEHGEKASRILAHQLRRSETAHLIPEIKTQSGQITTDPQKIN